jgi:glycosyltransferase involved in cell wall biosynthesis
MDCQFLQAGVGLVKCAVCGRSRKTTADPARLRMRCRAGQAAPAIAKPATAAKPRAAMPRPEPEIDWWPKDSAGQQIPTNDMTPEDLPCPHRGEVLRENVLCDLCGLQGVLYTVYACAKHGECSLVPRKKGGKLRDCFKCSIRHEALRMPLGTLPVVSGPAVARESAKSAAGRTGPVRVVFFSPGLLRGGAERWIVTLAKTWRTDVRATAVVLADWAGSEPDLVDELTRCGVVVRAGPHVSRAENSGSVVRSASLEWAARTALAECDVVISWGWGDVHQVLAKAGWTGPHVVVSHGACEWSQKLLDGPSRAATHLVAVSKAAADAFPAELREKAKILWNGIELDRIAPSRPRDVVRASWGCAPDDVLIGYVGRLAVSKNPVAAAAAAASIQQRFPLSNARPVLVGDGTHRDIVVGDCRALCGESLVLVDPPEHIGDAYAALDVLVLASPSEGMSLALIEAWAAGLPTVATPVGAVPELEEEFGRLTVRVNVGEGPEGLANLVLGATYRELTGWAQQTAMSHLSAAAMARRWAEFLGEVVR